MADSLKSAGLESALDRGIDIWGRRVFLQGAIEMDTVAILIRGMYVMADMSQDKPIELYICSEGGDIEAALALHDVTRTVRAPVHTVALGHCMSAAPLLVACGEPGHRYASPNCVFMTHAATLGLEGHIDNVEATSKAIRGRCERMDRLMAEYTDKDYRHWSRLSKSAADRYFEAEIAVDWGVVDSIWSEKSF